VKVFVIDR